MKDDVQVMQILHREKQFILIWLDIYQDFHHQAEHFLGSFLLRNTLTRKRVHLSANNRN